MTLIARVSVAEHLSLLCEIGFHLHLGWRCWWWKQFGLGVLATFVNGLVQHQPGKSCHGRQELRLSAEQSPAWQPVEWEGGYCYRPESAVTPLWVGEGLLCSGLGEPLACAQKAWQELPRSSVYKPIGTRNAHNCETPEDAVLTITIR